MVIKFDDSCSLKYPKYQQTYIPVVIINRTKKLISIDPILKITKYYDTTTMAFIAKYALVKGVDWDKLSDTELPRVTGIKKQDGYSTIPNSVIYLTPKGLELYLIAYTCKNNTQSRPIDTAFVKFCEDNLLDTKLKSEVTQPAHITALEQFRSENKYLDMNECLNGLDKIYADFKNLTPAIEKFKESAPQFKGFLIAMQRENNFVDELVYTMESFYTAYAELESISKSMRQHSNSNLVKEVVLKSIEDLLTKVKAIQ
jgi:hypothetical protein